MMKWRTSLSGHAHITQESLGGFLASCVTCGAVSREWCATRSAALECLTHLMPG